MKRLVFVIVLVILVGIVGVSGAINSDTLVNVGSPSTPFSQNEQNEPALAVDANHPDILVAGANDLIDIEACNAGLDYTCPLTPGVGISGVYFSFDSGDTWTQPTYTGWTARNCLGEVGNTDPACQPVDGPIGTLPWYYENGLVSNGDPALAFGPTPDEDGYFSWDNGSRLYYASLASNFGTTKRDETFRGFEAIVVSRTDDVEAAADGDKDAWMPPVIVSRQSSATFSDKEQIWADNAESSPFFGNVYVCATPTIGRGYAQPLIVATSTDGGETWTQRQVTAAAASPFNPKQGSARSGCTVRTDSNGVVYVFANQFGVGSTGGGSHIMVRSFNGGKTWTRPINLGLAVDTCFIGGCLIDGVAGARAALSSVPSVDIANGAPTGDGATNEILRTWVDGRDGLNNLHVYVSYSTDGGYTWSAPEDVASAGDRGFYSAIAISPQGTDAYLVYNAFTTPFRFDTTSPRGLVGVVKHADIASDGDFGAWSELHRGATGDPRGSSANNLRVEFLGDYVYAVATDSYGAAVWNDTRNAADCPLIDAYRSGGGLPSPEQHCPAGFGNSDIYGGSFADPTP